MLKRPRPSDTQPSHPSAAEIESMALVGGAKDLVTDPTAALRAVGDRLMKAASRPEELFQTNEAMAQELTNVLRDMFTIARQSEVQKKPYGPLDQLHVEGLDCESIWAELELRNGPVERNMRKALARLNQSDDISLAADIASDQDQDQDQNVDDDKEEESEVESSQEEIDDRADGSSLGDGQHFSKNEANYHYHQRDEQKPQGDDSRTKEGKKQADMFFDLEDMEQFADQGSAGDDLDGAVLDEMYGGENRSDSEDEGGEGGGAHSDIDDDDETEELPKGRRGRAIMDEDSTEESEEMGGVKHSDFYDDTPGQQQDDDEKGEEDDEQEENEDNDNDNQVSAHGQLSRHVKANISLQEEELLSEKPWALRGEVHSHDRPENSLLEAIVDVDRATRVVPPPTPELSISLLDMIKKRCLDGNWDDVMPRDVKGPPVRKEAPHLSQDKSKEGLGDLYEKEFLKKTMGVQEDDPQANVKNDLKQLFKKLCGKLDALCNFHYTPKTIIPEMKVQADVSAILMEEVLPSSVADAEAMGPEEVYSKKRGRDAEFLEGKDEMSQEERKRARSSKKAVRRKARREAEATKKLVSKLNPGLGNKYEKTKMLKDIQGAKNVETANISDAGGKEFSTSTKFFTKLQESVLSSIKAGGNVSREKGKATGESRGAQLRL